MVYLLEKNNSPRCTLEASKREQFTNKYFSDLIHEAHANKRDYYIGRVQCLEEGDKSIYFCYDARQLCKYIYEMVISTEGRKIRVKNFKDPISHQDIEEVHFFRLRYDSDAPLKAEYVGNHENFLETNSLRSKIFYSEDALDALSVNFQFNNVKKTNAFDKKNLIALFSMIVFLIILITGVVVIIEKNKKNTQPTKAPKVRNSVKHPHK